MCTCVHAPIVHDTVYCSWPVRGHIYMGAGGHCGWILQYGSGEGAGCCVKPAQQVQNRSPALELKSSGGSVTHWHLA